MAHAQRVTREEVAVVARLANLELPDERLDQLVTTLSDYLDNLDRLRKVDPGNVEPSVITYESEARQ